MPSKQAAKSSADSKKAAQTKPQARRHRSAEGARPGKRKWSAAVTRESDALDLQKGVFKSDSPDRIARSLKHSAVASRRRKADPFHSALSMLTFYINRAGRNLSQGRRHTLMAAKDKLRRLFGRKRRLSIKRAQ